MHSGILLLTFKLSCGLGYVLIKGSWLGNWHSCLSCRLRWCWSMETVPLVMLLMRICVLRSPRTCRIVWGEILIRPFVMSANSFTTTITWLPVASWMRAAPRIVSSVLLRMRLLNVSASLDLCGISSTPNVFWTLQMPNVWWSRTIQAPHSVSSVKMGLLWPRTERAAKTHALSRTATHVCAVRSKTTRIIVMSVATGT